MRFQIALTLLASAFVAQAAIDSVLHHPDRRQALGPTRLSRDTGFSGHKHARKRSVRHRRAAQLGKGAVAIDGLVDLVVGITEKRSAGQAHTAELQARQQNNGGGNNNGGGGNNNGGHSRGQGQGQPSSSQTASPTAAEASGTDNGSSDSGTSTASSSDSSDDSCSADDDSDDDDDCEEEDDGSSTSDASSASGYQTMTDNVKVTATKTKSSSSATQTSATTGQTYNGEATFYTQNGVAGACGTVASDSEKVVALYTSIYDNGANCGRKIQITNESGTTIEATVRDECPSCSDDSHIDLSTGAFDALGSASAGVLSVTWAFIS